jgi:RHS repeat-associated protein
LYPHLIEGGTVHISGLYSASATPGYKWLRSLIVWVAVSMLLVVLAPVEAVASVTVTEVQSAADASSGSSFTVTAGSAPTVGNLLVVGTAAGSPATLGTGESGWTKAVTSETSYDTVSLWYKIVDAQTDATVVFDLPYANQYAWVVAEYSAPSGWETSPLDVTAFQPMSGGTGDDQVASGTTTTPTVEGLGVAMFMARDGSGPVPNLVFSGDYSLVDRDGTLYGYPYSLEGFMAADTQTAATAQSTIASWTADDDRVDRGGVIAVFQPVAATPTESLTVTQNNITLTAGEVPAVPVVVAGSGGADAATSFSFDVGTADTDRVVAVYLDVESTGTDATGVTVDGNAATLVGVADNPSGAGNHSELWYIDEDDLGTSAGSVTVAAQGVTSLWGIQAVLLTGADQSGPHDWGVDDTAVATALVSPESIDVRAGGGVVFGAGEGTQTLTVSNITSPLSVLASHDPDSADMFLAAGVETVAQTGKSYVMTLSAAHNRASGVVASWGPVLPPATPVSDTVGLSTSDAGTATFTVTDDADWLTVTPASGTTDATLTVDANPAGLPVGDNTATVTVTAAGYSPVTVDVTLTITDDALVAASTAVSLEAETGGADASDSVAITVSTGATDTAFTVTDDAGWLTATASSPTPGSASLVASPTGLSADVYYATVTVSAAGYSDATIDVTFTVTAPPAPTLVAAETAVSLETDAGGTDVGDSVAITVANGDDTTFTVSDDASWLSVAASGQTPGLVSLVASPAGLSADVYYATVTMSAAGYSDATINVTFTVNPGTAGGPATLVQSAADGSSGSSFTVTAGSAPTVGNLLVIGTAAGSPATLGTGESGWTKAVTSETSYDTVSLWYKIVDAQTDATVVFDLPYANQYAWVIAEYSAPSGWETSPLDVTGSQAMSGGVGDNQVASGITGTPAAEGLGVAMFMARDGSGPVPNLVFSGDYSLVDRDGTLYGYPYSIEGFMAADTQTAVSAQSTVASWDTGDDRVDRGGVIAVFQPVASTPTESLTVTQNNITLTTPQSGPDVSQNVDVDVSGSTDTAFTATDDADWLTVTATSPTPGSVSLVAAAGSLTPGVYSATVTLSATGYTDAVIFVTFTVTEHVNTAPVANPVSVSGVAGNEITWTPDVSDTDGDDLSCSISSSTTGAPTVAADCSAGTFDATELVAGVYTFDYTVEDTSLEQDTATVSVTVTGNLPPTASSLEATGVEGTVINWTPQVTDPEQAQLSCTITDDPSGKATVASDCGSGTFDATYLPPGIYSFDYQTSDGEYTDTATVTVTVTHAGNNPPSASDLTASDETGDIVTFDLTVVDIDEGDTALLQCSYVSGTAEPDSIEDLITIDPDCATVTLDATNLDPGEYTLQYKATDTKDNDRGTITITLVEPAPGPVDQFATVQLEPAYIETVAGNGTSASVDGNRTGASFADPRAVAVTDEGVFVAEATAVRVYDRATGDVSTWLGDSSLPGCVDASDPADARFTDISYLAADETYLYVVDHCSVSGGSYAAIRRVDLTDGSVSTLSSDASNIPSPRGITAASDGYLYVTTDSSNAVRRYDTSSGNGTVVRTSGTMGAIGADETHLYVITGNAIEQIALSDYSVVTLVSGLNISKSALVVAGDFIYGAADGRDYLKRWSKSDGSESVVAGSGLRYDLQHGILGGFADGVENEAWFRPIAGLASDGSKLWIVDRLNYVLRSASPATPLPKGLTPFADEGIDISAPVVVPIDVTLEDHDGNPFNNDPLTFSDVKDVVVIGGTAYVANRDAIYAVALSTGNAELLAGIPGTVGCSDSPDPSAATFDINKMTTDGYWLYVFNNHDTYECDGDWSGGTQLQLRRVSTVSGAVSPIAVVAGYDDLTVGPDGRVYVATGFKNSALVRWIDPVSAKTANIAPVDYTSYNATDDAVAADGSTIWMVNRELGLGHMQRLWRFDLPDYAETMVVEGYPSNRRMLSAGSQLLHYGGSTLGLGDKDDGDWHPISGHGLTNIVGAAHDGGAIYVVDGTTNRLYMIVDGFNPPGGFAFGYDGYGTWRSGVNAGLGNFVWSATDHSIATVGPELAVSRVYNSADPRVGWFGLGWSSNYEMRWEADPAGNITVLYSDGRRETHVPDGSGGWEAPEGYFSVLEGSEVNGFTLTMKDNTVYTFNTDGGLESVEDGNGNIVELVYDETTGQLEQVHSGVSGRSLWFTWDGDYISEVATDDVAANGDLPYVWKYYYDGNELAQSCDPRNNLMDNEVIGGGGVCYHYTYTNGKITQIVKPEGNTDALVGYYPSGEVQWRRDGEGNETSFAKPEPNTVEITDARTYTSIQEFDDKYRVTKQTDPAGGVTQYRYDDDGNRIEVIDANHNNAVMTYDERGNMTSVTNGEGETSYFDYDSDDNLVGSADGRSSGPEDTTYQTTFSYDTVGNKTSETDPLGHTQTWDYTVGNESAVDVGYVPAGLLGVYRNANGNDGGIDGDYNTVYGYYHNGDLASVITPSGLRTDYTYDELGRVLTEKISDPVAQITEQLVATYTYDEVGNVLTVTGPVVNNNVSGEDHQLRTTNSYDDNSNLVTILQSDLEGNDPSRTTSMTYDNNDREETVTDPEGGVLEREYDQVGNVTAVSDQNGNRTETTYDNRNLPTTVTRISFDDGYGNVSNVVISSTTYDAAGRNLTVTDAEGRVTQWRYDDADRVRRVIQLNVSQYEDNPRSVLLSATTYDDAGNVETLTSGGGANQAVTTNHYDEAGRLDASTLTGTGDVNRVTTFDYDPAGNITQVSRSEDGRTETTESVFDVAGRLTESIVEPDGLALTTWYSYDARGNQTEIRDPRSASGTDPQYVTATTYDILLRPIVVESPEVAVEDTPGTVTQDQPTVEMGYDTFSNQTHTSDERNNVTVSEFDGVGRVVLITHPTYTDPDGTPITPTEVFGYDPAGNLDYEISRRGNRTDYDYDDANRVVRQTDPLVSGEESRGLTEIYYNDAGDKVKTKDPERGVVEWSYDELGRVTTETHYTDYGTLDEEAFVWQYGYDDLGNRAFIEDPSEYTTVHAYNAASEPTAVADINDILAEYEYDVAGRQVLATDAIGRSVASVYDPAGRLTDSVEYDRNGVEVATTSYGSDKAGNQTSVTSPRDKVTEWNYDELSRLISVEVPVDPDTPDIVTSYGYDAAGNPVRVTDGEGNDWYTSYNEWNLQETIVEPETDLQNPSLDDRTWVIGYDAGGLPVTETQPGDVTITRVFDELGRMTTETGIDSGVSATRTFGFDLNGRLTTVNHPSGTLAYTYDERGLMLTATGSAGATTFTYDEMGRMATRLDQSNATPYVFEWSDRSELDSLYDPVSNQTFDYVWDNTELDYVTYGTTGYERDYSWDNRGLLESDRLENSSDVAVVSATYTYDLDGNVDTENISLPNNPQSGQHSYDYDDAGRLTSWSFSNTDVAYEWDNNGNRITAGTDSYSYDERNRLVSGPDGDYTYTPRGTLSAIDDGTTTITYGFDPLGRLVDYNSQVTYSYDGLDRVAVRGTDTFNYVGTMLDPVDDGAFTYARTPGGRLISQTNGTDVLLTGLDRHGDLTWLFDPATGTVTDTAAYDPYGDPVATTGGTHPTVGYQGDYTDPDSNQTWMGARWYSAADAAFRSRDTIHGELNTPISLNRYTYAWANPNTYWDPDGHTTEYIPGLDGPELKGMSKEIYDLTHVTTSEGNRRRAEDIARRMVSNELDQSISQTFVGGLLSRTATELVVDGLSLWLYRNVFTINTTQLWLHERYGDSYAEQVASDSLLAEPWFDVLTPELRNWFAFAEATSGSAGLTAALAAQDWSGFRLETDQPANVCAVAVGVLIPCTRDIVEWADTQAGGYDYGLIGSSWYHDVVEPNLMVTALALEFWIATGSYTADGAPALRPGPNNTLVGPNGRFVTNPNSARSQAAAASSGGGVHGNSLAYSGPTSVYRLYDESGNFLKWGISNEGVTRYTKAFLQGGRVDEVFTGLTRYEAAAIERLMIELDPGPLNAQVWPLLP